MRSRHAALVGVVALAIVVRLAGIDHRLTPDEGYTWLVASASSAGSFLHRLAVYENTPPLYYLLLAPLALNDEPWIRLPSLIAGVTMVPILYAIVRPGLGARVALLSALGLAVAPYAVADSSFGRGFMVADLALLVAVWGAVRLADGGSWRWWLPYGAGAGAATSSEYDAATPLVALGLALVVLTRLTPPTRTPRWRTLALAALPALSFVPWLPQLARSLHQLDVTKAGGGYLTVNPGSVRDQLVTAFYGETGKDASAVARSLALLALIGGLAYGARAMRRAGARERPLLVILAWCGLGTLLLHALAPAVGVGIFDVGYLTFLIPVGLIGLARAVAAVPIRVLVPVASLALVLAGAGLTIKRMRSDAEPDPHALSTRLDREGAKTILTNSAVIAYYLRGRHPILDRPFNIGEDRERDCSGCVGPIAVVDDAGVGSGARPGPGRVTRIGHYVVRVVPRTGR
ncbi:MAG: glycosyltransferase family 39 protein [Solirubrobacteraceae bacterium]